MKLDIGPPFGTDWGNIKYEKLDAITTGEQYWLKPVLTGHTVVINIGFISVSQQKCFLGEISLNIL